MKMRKILSFVLVLSLVLGSFSMAFAATPATSLSDIAGIANEDAIQVNNDLGIIKGFPDGTFKPEQTVNRAEFAAMITRALAVPESALAGYTSTTFKDTAGYGWAVPYLAFAQSKGIMIGDGMGNAMPGRTINVNEAMTMVLRALGYVNHSAELVGSWPSNYVTVAQNVGLYDDVATTLTVNRASAAQIIYNALTVQKVAVNSDGETRYLTLSGTTTPAVLLNTGLGCTAVEVDVVGDDAFDWSINKYKHLGAKGTAYVKDDEVKAFTADSTRMIGYVNSDGKFESNSKTYEAKGFAITDSVVSLTNAVVATTDLDTLKGYDLVEINGKFSGKYITTISSIVLWNSTVEKYVSASNVKELKDNEFMNKEFIEDDNGDIDMNSFVLVGVKSLDDISVDDVVYVYTNGSDKIVKVAVGTDVVEGKVTQYNSKNDEFIVNGKTYMNAEDATLLGVTQPNKVTSANVSKDVKLYLDAYGFVFDVKSTTTTDKYGIYTGESDNFTKSVKIYTAADDAKKVIVAKDTPYATITGKTAGALIEYSVDKDGKIDAVNTADYEAKTATVTGIRSIQITSGGGVDKLAISENVVVFTATGASLDSGFEVSSIAKIDNKVTTASAIINKDNVVVALVVHEANAGKTTDDTYAVINTNITKYNETEDKTLSFVSGFANGAAIEKYTNSTGLVVTAGALGLYEIKFDGDGFIRTASTVDVDRSGTVGDLSVGANATALQLTTGDAGNYTINKNAVVYRFNASASQSKYYTVSDLNSISGMAYLYDTDSDTEGYDVVIFVK